MKSALTTCLLIIAGFTTPHAGYCQETDPPVHADHEMNALMKLWEQVSTPGAEHQVLSEQVGNWDTRTTMWMSPENPMVTSGKAKIGWVLGGRFLRQEFTGELMGTALSGIGYTGYDIYNKKYVGFWIDNSSTAMFTMEGAFDQSAKTLTMYGKADEWMTGERDKNVKYVLRFQGPDSFVFEVHDLSVAGEGAMMMEIMYHRAKGD